jgi:undecaprenyl-diphosphatase
MWISSAVRELDSSALRHLYGGGHVGALTWTMIAITVLGGGWGMLGLVPLLGWARSRHFAVSLTVVLLTAAGLVFELKRMFGRVRPCFAVPGVRALWGSPTDYSFPSGHTAGSFTFAAFVVTFVWFRRPRARIELVASVAAVLFAACVGVSRVYLGVHFASDVLGSALLGTLFGVAGALLCGSPESGARTY